METVSLIGSLKKILADILVDIAGVKLVYLFGSRVEGFVGPRSDYDFGVLNDRAVDGRQICGSISSALSHMLKAERIDVVLLNNVPVEMAYSIIAQGELIYQCDVFTRVEYEARVLGLYGDYLPVLRMQRHDIINRGDEYDSRVLRYRTALRRTERTLSKIRAF